MKTNQTITLEEIVSYLNDLAKLDNDFVLDLVRLRSKCNEKIKEYMTCFVGHFNEDNKETKQGNGVDKAGFIGILNDILVKKQVGCNNLNKVSDKKFNNTNILLVDIGKETNNVKFYTTNDYDKMRKIKNENK